MDREELLEEFLDSINEPVIVEGRKDREALVNLGVSNIVQLQSASSHLAVVESLADYDRVVILTDLDREGKNLRRKLLRLFGPYGIHENRKPREILAKLKVQQVESLWKHSIPPG